MSGEAEGSGKRGFMSYQAEMPYERFNEVGRENLTNRELIAILLRSGTRQEPVMALAEKVLQVRDNPDHRLSVLYDVSKEDLMEIPGIGEVKAVRLLAVLELSRRLSREYVTKGQSALVCDSAGRVADYFMETLRHESQERVLLLLLDTRMMLIRCEILTIGTVNASLCSTRDIFIRALRAGAVSILLLHNHPSGNPSPSEQDIALTRHVEDAGRLLDIRLIDHLIIGDLAYTSMKAEGFLTDAET